MNEIIKYMGIRTVESILKLASLAVVIHFPPGSRVQAHTSASGRDPDTGAGGASAQVTVENDGVTLTVPHGAEVSVQTTVGPITTVFTVRDWRKGQDAFVNGLGPGGGDIHLTKAIPFANTSIPGVTARYMPPKQTTTKP